ncbi:phage tail protein [Ralstonia sp.]|uniref:phage tail protein n=1 Tax=Ralstonia sp. TaxID=54061 RepID=UPI0031E1C1E5
MYQIDNSTAATTQPASTAAGTAGFFTDGNPATSTPATIVPAEWLNAVMLELVNVITGAGMTPTKNQFNQVLLAIKSMITHATGTLASSASLLSSNTTLTAAQTGTLFEVSSSPTITLPAVSATLSYMLASTSGGFTLSGGGGTIYFNGSSATSWTFPAGSSIAVYCDGGSWIIINFSGVSGNPTSLDSSLRAATTSFANSTGATVGSMRNAKMQVTAASATATFTADEIVVETALGGAPLRLASFNKSVNLGTVGAGGMDVGSAPVSGYVALYAIYNPTTGTAALLATNATSSAVGNIYGGANMPSGYTASALVSVWPTNSSGQFIVGYQRDRRISRNGITVLNSNTAQASYTSVSAASAIPPNAVFVSGSLAMTSTSTGSAMTINVAGDSGGSGVQNYGSAIPTGGIGQGTDFVFDVITSQTLYYQSTNTAGTPTYQITISRYEI